MSIDFTPINAHTQKIRPFAAQYTLDEIRAAAVESAEFILGILDGLDDDDVTFVPYDPDANDPYASPEEQNIGWTIAHLVVHVTASTEEYAATGSVLARGINFPPEPRLRYETLWHTVTTQAQCVQRIKESLRMRLAYLDAFPDTILDGIWQRSEKFFEIFGELDAKGTYLLGLSHEVGHQAQFEEVRRQALAAKAEKAQ